MSKFEYEVGAMKELGGEGISGMATRSDMARSRELAKYGLTLAWFDQKNTEQNGLCADCGKQEKAKLANGKHKQLGLGFGPDGKPSRLICQNCAAAQRKERAAQKNAPKSYESFEEFWQVNREQLQKEDALQFAMLRERDQDVREIYEIIGIYLRSDVQPGCHQLEDTLNEVETELIEHGTTDLDQLSAPFYRVEHRHLFDEIQHAAEATTTDGKGKIHEAPKHARNATIYAKYGLLQALPVSLEHKDVREFLRQNGRWEFPDWSPKPNPVRTIKCSTYGCHNNLTYNVQYKVKGWYFSEPTGAVVPPPVWFCNSCRAKSASKKPTGVKPRPEDVLYSAGHGHMSDLQSKLPEWLA